MALDYVRVSYVSPFMGQTQIIMDRGDARKDWERLPPACRETYSIRDATKEEVEQVTGGSFETNSDGNQEE